MRGPGRHFCGVAVSVSLRLLMKTLKFVVAPTRNRRLNELLGLLMLVAAILLLLSIVSYRPTDPRSTRRRRYTGHLRCTTGPAWSAPRSAICCCRWKA